jgi:hypothetical protein
MLNISLYFIVCILALYGLISLILSVVNTICDRAGIKNERIKLVLIVKNQQDTIEGVIRNILAGNLLRRIMSGRKLTIIDIKSTDETLKILQVLKDDYEWLEILCEDEKEKIFEEFNQTN